MENTHILLPLSVTECKYYSHLVSGGVSVQSQLTATCWLFRKRRRDGSKSSWQDCFGLFVVYSEELFFFFCVPVNCCFVCIWILLLLPFTLQTRTSQHMLMETGLLVCYWVLNPPESGADPAAGSRHLRHFSGVQPVKNKVFLTCKSNLGDRFTFMMLW